MSLAPIILFVYNRPWHTEQCLEALTHNVLADLSTLYVYCDGPKNNASEEDLKKIKKVRQVIRKKEWCNEVIILERNENLGLANSVIKGVSEVIEKHGKVIVLEDDIVTGKYFLKFMNESLEIYQHEEKVFGISGYKYPSKGKIEDSTYFLPISCSWSYATWLNRWRKVNFNENELLEFIQVSRKKYKMNFGGFPFYEMLEDQLASKVDSWAIRFYASMFLAKGLFLYPNRTLVENIGFDNSGQHCDADDYFKIIKNRDEKIKISKLKIKLKRKNVNLIRKNFELKYLNSRWFNFNMKWILKVRNRVIKML